MIDKRRWIWTIATFGAAVVIALAFVASAIPLRSEALKQKIIETLGERLNSDVTLDDVSLRLYPRLHVRGKGLHIKYRRRPDLPPLITVKEFTVDADLMGVLKKRLSHVELVGLDISIPPKDPDDDGQKDRRDDRHDHRLHSSVGAGATPGTSADRPRTDPPSFEDGVVIDRLDSTNARLVIVPRESNKTPKVWQIHTLRAHHVGAEEPMPFDAALTNAVPPGEIIAHGKFGPWNRNVPGDTPLDGSFTFDRADLSVFKGIAGTLSSRGTFGGALNYIDVRGETETPDFVIAVGGHPFPLSTKYHTIVDGTNGDTRLERIDARLLRSVLVAKGAVLDGASGQEGRTVTLDLVMSQARIEDVMRMAINSAMPPMTGALQLNTAFLLPPGASDVVDRLQLNGRFSMTNAKFSNPQVQSKIVELSHRGRGRHSREPREAVASDFQGRFVLRNGRLELEQLMFAVPGAQVRLAGNYGLKQETLAFKGDLLMDAKVSQIVGGFKSLMLKIVDPLFSRDGGGSSVPIKIEGTRNDPKFGIDMGRVFNRGDD